jgi:hypothetical protein
LVGRVFLFIVVNSRNIYILLVTFDMLMVIASSKRTDTAVRISRWLDEAVEGYISDKKMRVKFPSKRNFVDTAVMQLLEEKGVKLNE